MEKGLVAIWALVERICQSKIAATKPEKDKNAISSVRINKQMKQCVYGTSSLSLHKKVLKAYSFGRVTKQNNAFLEKPEPRHMWDLKTTVAGSAVW